MRLPSPLQPGRTRPGRRVMRASSDRDSALGCVLCELSGPPEDARVAGDLVVAHATDAVVALIEPGRSGVVIAPRKHVTTMTAASAPVLAALRQAILHVEEAYGAPSARIERTADVPGATGHMCYRIVPYLDERSLPAAREDARSSARRLARTMRGSPGRGGGEADPDDLGPRDTVSPAKRARRRHPPLPSQ